MNDDVIISSDSSDDDILLSLVQAFEKKENSVKEKSTINAKDRELTIVDLIALKLSLSLIHSKSLVHWITSQLYTSQVLSSLALRRLYFSLCFLRHFLLSMYIFARCSRNDRARYFASLQHKQDIVILFLRTLSRFEDKALFSIAMLWCSTILIWRRVDYRICLHL